MISQRRSSIFNCQELWSVQCIITVNLNGMYTIYTTLNFFKCCRHADQSAIENKALHDAQGHYFTPNELADAEMCSEYNKLLTCFIVQSCHQPEFLWNFPVSSGRNESDGFIAKLINLEVHFSPSLLKVSLILNCTNNSQPNGKTFKNTTQRTTSSSKPPHMQTRALLQALCFRKLSEDFISGKNYIAISMHGSLQAT